MYEMYPGTSGRTHGDRNDTTPAANAAASPIFDASVMGLKRIAVGRSLRLGVEHPSDRRLQSPGGHRADDGLAGAGLVVADDGRRSSADSRRIPVRDVLLHALDGRVIVHAFGQRRTFHAGRIRQL